MTDSKTNNILMVITSHSELGNTGEKTGFWVEEFAAPYYAFIDAGVQVTLASPAGGQPPIDPKSEMEDFQTTSTKRFDADAQAQALVANTAKLADMSATDYSAVFYPGDSTDSIALIENFLAANKPVAAVCHATAAFLNIKDANGEYLVKGKAITGFTNSEEAAVQLTDVVPFLLEDEFVERGGDFQKVADWNAFAVQDGLLISGQNPASSELAAKKLLAALAS
jgi:putative intracellular protease/amidase